MLKIASVAFIRKIIGEEENNVLVIFFSLREHPVFLALVSNFSRREKPEREKRLPEIHVRLAVRSRKPIRPIGLD